MSGTGSRKTVGLYINEDVFKAFTLYASKHKPLKACEIWEKALLQYMKNNPTELISLEIQQHIMSTLPERRDVVRMKSISRKLETFMNLIDSLNGKGDISKLEEKLLTWVARGAEVKNPTEEFVELLERAINYV